MKKTIHQQTKTPILCDHEENGKIIRTLITEELYIKRIIAVVEILEDQSLKIICKELGIQCL